MLDSFFKLWARLEEKISFVSFSLLACLMKQPRADLQRDFYAPPQSELTDEDIANAIGDYISCMDSCIQLYFDNAAEPETAARKVSEMYERYLKKRRCRSLNGGRCIPPAVSIYLFKMIREVIL